MKKYQVVYEPKGQALEYAPLAVNLFNGCTKGCKYCYAPACRRMQKDIFHQESIIRKNVLYNLQMDAEEMQKNNDNRRTLFCFITDPYQDTSEKIALTRRALLYMRKHERPFQILTKSAIAIHDFHLYSKEDYFAMTLTFMDEAKSIEWEPKASNPTERLNTLKAAKKQGIYTWVSFEPVIDPGETLKLFDASYEFIDEYKIGKLNNYAGPEVPTNIDWKKFTDTIVNKCIQKNKKYYIKKSLQPYLEA